MLPEFILLGILLVALFGALTFALALGGSQGGRPMGRFDAKRPAPSSSGHIR